MGYTKTLDLVSQSAKSKAVTAAGKDGGIGSRAVRDSYSLRLITDGNTPATELDIETAFRRQLEYKLKWLGGKMVVIPPQYTSQTCSHCGCVDRANRPTQAKFKCTACGFEANADHNAALNILAAGRAVSACGAGRAQAPALKQEPAYGAAR